MRPLVILLAGTAGSISAFLSVFGIIWYGTAFWDLALAFACLCLAVVAASLILAYNSGRQGLRFSLILIAALIFVVTGVQLNEFNEFHAGLLGALMLALLLVEVDGRASRRKD
jgi:hypothetical protein